MRAAVLIVNYRTYDALGRCLGSLEPELSERDEVVVVDWETRPDRVADLARRHPRVTWITRSDNRGFAAGVNLAAAASRAPVLILLNPDTEVAGPLPHRLAEHLSRHPQCVVVGPQVLNQDGSLQPSARRFPGLTTVLGGRSTWLTRRFPNNYFTRRNLLTQGGAAASVDGPAHIRVDWLAGSCFATPRRVFESAGGLDEGFFMYWEDADYCRRATAAGGECHYLPVVTVRHVGGASSALNVVPSIRAFHRSAYRLFARHAGVGRVMAPAVWLGLRARAELRVLGARLRLWRGSASPW